MGITNFDGNVDADYLKETARLLQDLKETSYTMMDLSAGSIVLDIGCGPGIDVFNISKIVGPTGKVVGLDIDSQMIAEAQKNYTATNITFTVGEAGAIPYPDNYFNAVRAERLFQVLPKEVDPNRIVTEIIRVTKKDGLILLIDTDWGSASLDYDDIGLTQRLLYFFATHCRPNGFSGRQFYRLLKSNGLSVNEIVVKPIITLDYRETPFGDWLIKEALTHNIASEMELANWNQQLIKKNTNQEFFSVVNMILVSGRK